MEKYDINDIQSLDFRTGVRSRIQMYLGSDDTDGIYQSFKEIVNNSTDEAIAGYGDKIEIELDEEKNKISIRDYGRGVPFGIRENGENVLVSIFTKSHTGGKFDKKAYKNSSGLNGMGGSAVCLSSNSFKVESYRDGKKASAEFNKGELIEYKEASTKEENGTLIIFQPDKEVFKNMTDGFTFERVCEEIKNVAYLNKGIHFLIKTKDKNKEFYSKNGIADFIMDKVKNPLMKKPIVYRTNDEIDELEIAFIWTKDISNSFVFVNGLYCPEGGSPITGAKTALTTQIKKLSKKDFEPEVIRKGLIYAINCKVSEPSFANQTKTKINNTNLRTLAGKAFKEALDNFAKTSEFNTIIDMLTKVQRAENAASKAREAALQNNGEIQKELKKKIILAEKLADSRKHDETSQLMICEGKSAKGALVKARDSETTACFDLRGKLINTLKNSEDKVSLNEEVKQLHIALGCGLGEKFNISKLRYGKIVMMADMDKDRI